MPVELSGMKLGKLEPKIDPRTLRLMDVLKALPTIPTSYDVDNQFSLKMPTGNIYSNSQYGDCVVAAQAHMTLRLEAFEQHKLVNITTKNVTDEYFKQTGGPDSGLYILNSLKCWRNDGWSIDETIPAATRTHKRLGCWKKKPVPPPDPPAPVVKQHHSIAAFGAIDWKNYDDINACIYLLNGVDMGVALPNTAKTQEVWDVVGDPKKDKNSKPGSWGRHGIYVKAYHVDIPSHGMKGFVCVTWGYPKFMTERFWDTYIDESYGVVDKKNLFTPSSPVDEQKLMEYLEALDN